VRKGVATAPSLSSLVSAEQGAVSLGNVCLNGWAIVSFVASHQASPKRIAVMAAPVPTTFS